MTGIGKRLAALEQSQSAIAHPWVRLWRHEGETRAQAVATYEAEHGSIGDSNVIMRVIVSKSGTPPDVQRIS